VNNFARSTVLYSYLLAILRAACLASAKIDGVIVNNMRKLELENRTAFAFVGNCTGATFRPSPFTRVLPSGFRFGVARFASAAFAYFREVFAYRVFLSHLSYPPCEAEGANISNKLIVGRQDTFALQRRFFKLCSKRFSGWQFKTAFEMCKTVVDFNVNLALTFRELIESHFGSFNVSHVLVSLAFNILQQNSTGAMCAPLVRLSFSVVNLKRVFFLQETLRDKFIQFTSQRIRINFASLLAQAHHRFKLCYSLVFVYVQHLFNLLKVSISSDILFIPNQLGYCQENNSIRAKNLLERNAMVREYLVLHRGINPLARRQIPPPNKLRGLLCLKTDEA
jgi:hypothetical protein